MKKFLIACILALCLVPISSIAATEYEPYDYNKAKFAPSTYKDFLTTMSGTVVASTYTQDGGFAFFVDVDNVHNDTALCLLFDDLEQAEEIKDGCFVEVIGLAAGDSTEFGLPVSYPTIVAYQATNVGQLRADSSAQESGVYVPYDYNEARFYSKYYWDTPIVLRGKVVGIDEYTYKVKVSETARNYVFSYSDTDLCNVSVSVGDYVDIYGTASGLLSDIGLDDDSPVVMADRVVWLGTKYPGDLEPKNQIDSDGSIMTLYTGLYEVGNDIPAGSYIITAPDMRFTSARHGQNLRKDKDGYTVESDETSDVLFVYNENSSRYRSGERVTQVEYTVKDGYYFEVYHAPMILTPVSP